MRRDARLTREAGLTLIELMVAVLLASILSTGLFYLTVGQTRTYETQLKQVNLQEALWAAMEHMQRQIRMAGYGIGGCPGGVVKRYNCGEGGVDAAIVADEFTPIRVYNSCDLLQYSIDNPGCNGPTGVAPCTAACTGPSDAIAVTYGNTTGDLDMQMLKITDDKKGDGANPFIKAAGPGSCGLFTAADYIVLKDPGSPKDCVLFMAKTATWDAGKGVCEIKINTGSDPPGCTACPCDPNPPPGTAKKIFPNIFGTNSMVFRLGPGNKPVKFAIDRTKPLSPRLVQWSELDRSDLQVIAEGIEDMQVSWACDLNNNQTLEEGAGTNALLPGDEWAYNGVGSDALTGLTGTGLAPDNVPTNVSYCATAVAAVRVTLIARALSPELGNNTGRRPGAEDRAPGTVADDLTLTGNMGTFPRAVLTSLIKPRNSR